MTAFIVVLGLAIWAPLRMRAAARFARQDRAGTAAEVETEGAFCDAPLVDTAGLPRHISRSAGVPRSFLHALRAPGLLCEQIFVVISRRAALGALGPANLSARARMQVRIAPESG